MHTISAPNTLRIFLHILLPLLLILFLIKKDGWNTNTSPFGGARAAQDYREISGVISLTFICVDIIKSPVTNTY